MKKIMINQTNTSKLTSSILSAIKGLIVLTAVLTSLIGPRIFADSEITMSPASDRIELKAGQKFDGSFTIFNSGTTDYNFEVSAAPYQITNEKYEQNFTKQTSRTQLSRWISFPKTKFFLKAGKNVKIDYQVNVPKNIPDGGQYAALFAETESSKEGNVLSKKRVGLLLYASTDGKTIEKAEIADVSLKSITFDSNLQLIQNVSNRGNTDFDANVKLSIDTLFGKNICSDEKPVAVLPDTTRAIELNCKVPGTGLFKVDLETKALDQNRETSKVILFISPITLIIAAVAITAIIVWKINASKKKNYRRR